MQCLLTTHLSPMRVQQITNTGTKALTVPYTFSIYNPSYALIAGQAWNWGASGSSNGGTFSGSVSMVRAAAAVLCITAEYFTFRASLLQNLSKAVPWLSGSAGART